MLSSKSRAKLSALANSIKPVIHVGKTGLTDGIVDATSKAVQDHQLIKIRFVDFKDEIQSLAQGLAEKTNSELVRIIGYIAILYKQNPEKDNLLG